MLMTIAFLGTAALFVADQCDQATFATGNRLERFSKGSSSDWLSMKRSAHSVHRRRSRPGERLHLESQCLCLASELMRCYCFAHERRRNAVTLRH
jgi:hypothetical protein